MRVAVREDKHHAHPIDDSGPAARIAGEARVADRIEVSRSDALTCFEVRGSVRGPAGRYAAGDERRNIRSAQRRCGRWAMTRSVGSDGIRCPACSWRFAFLVTGSSWLIAAQNNARPTSWWTSRTDLPRSYRGPSPSAPAIAWPYADPEAAFRAIELDAASAYPASAPGR